MAALLASPPGLVSPIFLKELSNLPTAYIKGIVNQSVIDVQKGPTVIVVYEAFRDVDFEVIRVNLHSRTCLARKGPSHTNGGDIGRW